MRRGLVMLCAALMLATAMAGCLDSAGLGNSAPSVEMSIEDGDGKTTTFRVGDELTFDATGSSDPNGDPLTFEWDFDDGNLGEGQTIKHTYNVAREYLVELCVKDSDLITCKEQSINVAEAGAAFPMAEITGYKDNDCEGDTPSSGTHTMVWICEENMDSSSDTFVDATTTVYLDGSESEPGDANSYITKYEWDLNVNVDSDNDGDEENDADLLGEAAEWTNVVPGEYEIKLTVTDNNGYTSDDEMKVYVNYRGTWAEFTIDGNGTQGAAEVTFGFPVVYDSDEGNTIRKAKVLVTYPIEDDDWAFGSADNRLDLYAFNETEEEVVNTSSTLDEDHSSGDCDTENDRCLELYIGGTTIRANEDGDWTVDLVNEKQWDTTVKSFIILLEYK